MERLSKNAKNEQRKGQRLKTCREAKGLSQQQLADMVNGMQDSDGQQIRACNKPTVSKHENKGNISPAYAALYGQALGVDPDFLLCKTDCRSAAEARIQKNKDDAERVATINRIIKYAGFRIDYDDPWHIEGVDDVFYYVWRESINGPDKREATVRHSQLAALTENIIDLVRCQVEGVLRMSPSLDDVYADYKKYYENRQRDEVDLVTPQPELGERMRACREAAGMDVKTLADKIGVPCATIESWESGQSRPKGAPEDNQFTRWAEALGLSVEKITIK